MKILVLLLLIYSGALYADEIIAPPHYWLGHGYTEIKYKKSRAVEMPQWLAHSLSWPVDFQDAKHSMGNSMLEFQSYGSGPYFHGGCDLRVQSAAQVSSPVKGKIEAGHYGYSNLPDGSMKKYWHPWPQAGDSHYFEVAVVTEDGFRFEFHHMDRKQLSDRVLKILENGQGQIEAGEILGKTIPWPDGEYHHTHYNILTASGVQINPEYYSPLIPDNTAPLVSAVLASFKNGKTAPFGNGEFREAPEFFALGVIDHQDQNIYDHPPVLAGITFEDGNHFVWDFRQRLLGPDGKFPSIWKFFVESISGPEGETLETEGGYGEGLSVIRIPVPSLSRGKFTLEIQDQNGNSTRFQGSIKSTSEAISPENE